MERLNQSIKVQFGTKEAFTNKCGYFEFSIEDIKTFNNLLEIFKIAEEKRLSLEIQEITQYLTK